MSKNNEWSTAKNIEQFLKGINSNICVMEGTYSLEQLDVIFNGLAQREDSTTGDTISISTNTELYMVRLENYVVNKLGEYISNYSQLVQQSLNEGQDAPNTSDLLNEEFISCVKYIKFSDAILGSDNLTQLWDHIKNFITLNFNILEQEVSRYIISQMDALSFDGFRGFLQEFITRIQNSLQSNHGIDNILAFLEDSLSGEIGLQINSITNLIKFFNENNNLISNENADFEYISIVDAITPQLVNMKHWFAQLLEEPLLNSHDIDSDTVIIKGCLVDTRFIQNQINNNVFQDVNTINVFANSIYLNEHLVLFEKNLNIIAFNWYVENKISINLRGLDRDEQPEINEVALGSDGLPGHVSGNFVGFGLRINNADILSINLVGGTGGQGSDGFNGSVIYPTVVKGVKASGKTSRYAIEMRDDNGEVQSYCIFRKGKHEIVERNKFYVDNDFLPITIDSCEKLVTYKNNPGKYIFNNAKHSSQEKQYQKLFMKSRIQSTIFEGDGGYTSGFERGVKAAFLFNGQFIEKYDTREFTYIAPRREAGVGGSGGNPGNAIFQINSFDAHEIVYQDIGNAGNDGIAGHDIGHYFVFKGIRFFEPVAPILQKNLKHNYSRDKYITQVGKQTKIVKITTELKDIEDAFNFGIIEEKKKSIIKDVGAEAITVVRGVATVGIVEGLAQVGVQVGMIGMKGIGYALIPVTIGIQGGASVISSKINTAWIDKERNVVKYPFFHKKLCSYSEDFEPDTDDENIIWPTEAAQITSVQLLNLRELFNIFLENDAANIFFDENEHAQLLGILDARIQQLQLDE